VSIQIIKWRGWGRAIFPRPLGFAAHLYDNLRFGIKQEGAYFLQPLSVELGGWYSKSGFDHIFSIFY
jgi:hypothetical protein